MITAVTNLIKWWSAAMPHSMVGRINILQMSHYTSVYLSYHQQTFPQTWVKFSETLYGITAEQDFIFPSSICHLIGEDWNFLTSNCITGHASCGQPLLVFSPVMPLLGGHWGNLPLLTFLFICTCIQKDQKNLRNPQVILFILSMLGTKFINI